jgi:hypothetical protein
LRLSSLTQPLVEPFRDADVGHQSPCIDGACGHINRVRLRRGLMSVVGFPGRNTSSTNTYNLLTGSDDRA